MADDGVNDSASSASSSLEEELRKKIEEQLRLEYQQKDNELEETRKKNALLENKLKKKRKKHKKEKKFPSSSVQKPPHHRHQDPSSSASSSKATRSSRNHKERLEAHLLSTRNAVEAFKQKKEGEANKKFEALRTRTHTLHQQQLEAELQRHKELKDEAKRQEEEEKTKKRLDDEFKQKEAELKRNLEEQKQKIAEEAEQHMKAYNIKLSTIEFGEELGEGAFGKVSKAKLRGKDVAVKVLFNQDLDSEAMDDFKNEITIMSNLHHPNIILLMGACTEPGHLCIVTELLRGSLEDILFKKKEDVSMNRRLNILKDAALAMNWLHQSNPPLIHRDLKTGNLLVDHAWNVKIADFGLSSVKTDKPLVGLIGSMFYGAPEVLMDNEYDEKVDVYSFAVIVCEVLSGVEVYQDEVFESAEEFCEAIYLDGKRPKLHQSFPKALLAFLQAAWHKDPESRPSFEQIVKEKQIESFSVDIVLKDPLAVHFWKESFTDRWDEVAWSHFATAFNDYFGKSIETDLFYAKCLKTLLCGNQGKEVVQIEDFARVLYYYGPLDPDCTFLHRLSVLCAQNWFFGEFSKGEAEAVVKAKKEAGQWIVWFDRTKRNQNNQGARSLFLSVSAKKGSHHYAFTQSVETGKFAYEGTEYFSIEDLVRENKKIFNIKTATTSGSVFEGFISALKPSRALDD